MKVVSKREYVFSIMKGIAIISVVMGHCTLNRFTELYVNQFHLAVFFFVSGYFFKEEYCADRIRFICKKFRRLYVPFVISGVIMLLFYPLMEWLYIYETPLTLKGAAKEVFNLTIRLTSDNTMMGAMWFCPALLIVSLLSFAVFCLTKQRTVTYKTVVFALVVATGGVILHWFRWKSPYCIWQYMIIAGIYYMGWLFHRCEPKLTKHKDLALWIVSSVCFFLVLYVLTFYGCYGRLQPNNINNEYTMAILLVAFVGCGGVYSLSVVISRSYLSSFFALMGEYSFSIMLLHFLCFKIVNCLYCLVNGVPFDSISSFPTIRYEHAIWFCVYLLTGTLAPVSLSRLYHKCKDALVSL